MTTQEIADHVQITQVIQRYGKAIDEKRFDLLATLFTPDAQLVYLVGKQLIECRMEEAQGVFKSFLTKCYWTSHLISDPVIEFRHDGAHTSSRVSATHIQIRDDGSRNVWIVSGSYEDEFTRDASGWRIRKRVTIAPHEQGSFLAGGVREFRSPPSVKDLAADGRAVR
jgi:SnoaL-like domain